jgi:hypothetical protein
LRFSAPSAENCFAPQIRIHQIYPSVGPRVRLKVGMDKGLATSISPYSQTIDSARLWG